MLIPFQSKASADFFMMDTHVRTLFALLDKPFAPQGVFAADEVNGYLLRLRAALERAQTLAPSTGSAPQQHANEHGLDADPHAPQAVGLKQRAWPLLDMLAKAAQKKQDVTWGTL